MKKIAKKKLWIPLAPAGAALALFLAWHGGLLGSLEKRQRSAGGASYGEQEASRHAEEEGEHHGEERMVLLDEKELKEFGIPLAEAGPGVIEIQATFPGEVALDPDRLAHIVPRAPGIARQMEVRIGDRVRAGAVLAWLESAELGEAKAAFLAARRRLELARTDLERERAVHDNTLKMLELLASSPSLDALSEMEAIEMGEYRSRLVAAYAECLFSEAAYRREKGLYEKKITSQGGFLDAERAYKKARSRYVTERDSIAFSVKRALLDRRRALDVAELDLKAAERTLHLLGLTDEDLAGFEDWSRNDEKLAWYALRAPFAGRVIAKHITRGERLARDDTAFTLADLSTVWIELTVYQKDLDRVREGQEVWVSTGPEGPEAVGRIDYISPLLDEATRTATARVELPNPEGRWRPGMFVSGRVSMARIEAALVVPRTALQVLGGREVVFVHTGEGFEPRPVTTDRADARFVEVTKGLAAGTVYAAANAFTLKAELNKASFGEGHAH